MSKNKLAWVYEHRYIIGALVTCAILGYVGYRIIKKDKKINMELGNTTEKVGNLIFTTPIAKIEKYKIVLVFGGIDYATPQYMLTKVPKELLSQAVFVFAPYTMSFDSVIKEANTFFVKKNIGIKDLSIIGFSAGGLNVQRAYNSSFKFVGLIDPSTRSEFVDTKYGKNTRMVYNDNNWGAYPTIKAVLPKLANSINEDGGNAERVNLAHANIPQYFFDKYKQELFTSSFDGAEQEKEIVVNSSNDRKLWDSISEERLAKLHPMVRSAARQFINNAEDKGIFLRITSTLRTFKEQNELYAQGRTTAGKIVTNSRGGDSFHNYGLALDVVEIVNGKAVWNSQKWNEIGKLGKEVGFAWGGDWIKFVDKPHFEMNFSHTLFWLKEQYNKNNRVGEYVNL